jgi:putative serine protease PepD
VILLTALVTAAVTLILLRWGASPWGNTPPPPTPGAARASETPSAAAEAPLSPDEEVNFRVYNKVSPGVVNITSIAVEFDFFFRPYPQEGTGSGCVLDKEGHVLTNHHVIANAQSLEVSLPDHTKYRAKVVGIDRQNDLAVIRLVSAPAERLYPITLGDSSRLKVGQKVLAIGNPFRLQNTLTVGIVSSLGRTIRTDDGDLVENVIQTDAAINPGNSGGPLLNTLGEMIGINTAIVSPREGNVGIGFAIPSSTIRRIADDLIKEGRVVRPWLGVEGYAVSDDLATALELPVNKGFLVTKVYRGSSADNAGIRGASEIAVFYNERLLAGGDIITEIDGRPITSMDDIQLALENKRPGQTVQVSVYRGRARSQKAVLLAERPRGLRF